MKNLTFIVLTAFFLTGCSEEITEITKQDFDPAFTLNSSSTCQGHYYLGNDEEYHYFTSRWKFESDKIYKISKNDSMIVSPLKNEAIPSGIWKTDFQLVRLSFLIQGDSSLLFFIFCELESSPQISEKPQIDAILTGKPRPQVRRFKSREELQTHLRDQQMDAIRSGKPPRPIPLTHEMESQLVEEGVLPPK